MRTKNILIAITGLTPQVVTEALYCLSVQQKEKINIDEIYIITTSDGKEAILGKHQSPKTPKVPLKNEIERFCRHYNVSIPIFENNETHIITADEESIELYDVWKDKDNKLFPNCITKFIREKSFQDNTVLYCCIAGGRKTMSVYMAFALSLFGREHDKLFHVLASKSFEETQKFFPDSLNEKDEVVLSNVPYIRLRPILYEKYDMNILSYNQLVGITESELKILSDIPVMIINLKDREIKVNKKKITSLEPIELAIYSYFVNSKLRGINYISINELMSKETAREISDIYFDIRGKKLNIKTLKDGLSSDGLRHNISEINKKIRYEIQEKEIYEHFIIDRKRKYGCTEYGIKGDKSMFRIL